METHALNVKPRQTKGGPKPSVLRQDGLMPAIVYGQGREPLALTVDMNELKNLLNHITSQSLIALNADGDPDISKKIIMIKELQRHPLSQKFLHADFYEVDMTKKINVNIPVVTVGECLGEEDGGVLQVIRRELEVNCLPGDIPVSIEIDVSQLTIGDSIHMSEITTDEKTELTWDPENEADYTVIAVAAPTIEEEPEEEALEEGEEGVEGEEGEGEGEESGENDKNADAE
jgi:large subunit ribosomal protein L25